ncbi:NADH dehydrogenase [ubiquinone] 1 alpha subcomplex subunit 11 [Choloepus didactylus]|uniref:NADH dehydrogenase [ubiquinone] 1 alpha subcomplex subunit 11 n=1 Tax=Choloepus didactylus TaxID=27675 RepID=UPI00189EDD54|nr:NADH dehydrogenase [ubiquinone] 1 alpha subcomplex subunit 11 [Choloepus didactylus]
MPRPIIMYRSYQIRPHLLPSLTYPSSEPSLVGPVFTRLGRPQFPLQESAGSARALPLRQRCPRRVRTPVSVSAALNKVACLLSSPSEREAERAAREVSRERAAAAPVRAGPVGSTGADPGLEAIMRSLFQQYWDIPDGTECHRKAYAATGVGGAVGLVVSAYSVTLQPADTFVEGVARAGRYTFTAAAIGAMFSLASCISAQVREKPDDPLNYFIGGCAGGLTLGARTHSSGTGAAACVCFGTIAALTKIGRLEGWKVFSEPKV